MTSALIFALLLAQQTAPPEKCKLSGTVVDSITGQPLSKVSVLAEHTSGNEPAASTTSNAKGQFHLVELDPGSYRITIKRSGYLDSTFGARRASGSEGSTINLTPGQELEDLHLTLTPFGVIAGTVRDSDGEPVASAAVVVYSAHYEGDHRRIVENADTTTNDLGEYRITELPAGKYYVSAVAHSRDDNKMAVDHSAKSATPKQVSVTTFYPGAMDPSGAIGVELASGARRTDIDIDLSYSPLYTITAHVEAHAGLQIQAHLGYTTEGFEDVGHFHPIDDKGNVEIVGVPPGSYTLALSAAAPRKPFDGTYNVFENRDGCASHIPVSVERSNVEGLRLTAAVCAELSGRIVREDGKALKYDGAPVVILDGSLAYIKDDLFRLTTSPGHANLDFSNLVRVSGLYLKSVRSGSQDILRNGFTVSSSEHLDMEVVLGSDGGRIEGVASNPDGNPTPGVTVVLVPNDPALRARMDYTPTVVTDQSGHYEIKNAAPGEYKLFAWDDLDKDSWFDPDVLKDFESKGSPVSIKTSLSQTINLQVIQ